MNMEISKLAQKTDPNQFNQQKTLKQKEYLLSLLGIVILVLVIGTGISFLRVQKNQYQNSQTQPSSNSSASNDTPQKLTGSFQEIMEEHCKGSKRMKIEDLPVSIVPTVLTKISNQTEFPVGCQYKLEPMTWNAAIYNDKNYTSLYISDNPDKQAGPTYKELIKSSEDIKISIWHEDNPYNAEKDTIRGLGEKDLRLSNGEMIYVKFELALMDKSNPKFSKLKSSVSIYEKEAAGQPASNPTLYSDLTKTSPEKDHLALIEEVLHGVTAK